MPVLPHVVKLTVIALRHLIVTATQFFWYGLVKRLAMMEFIRFFEVCLRLEVSANIVRLLGWTEPRLIGWRATLFIDLHILFKP